MVYRYVLSVVIFMLALAGNVHAQILTPQDGVNQTITQVITLYEQGDYLQIINEYANISDELHQQLVKAHEQNPESLKNILARLFDALKEVQGKPATFSENNAQASYSLDTSLISKRLVFTNVAGRWKINN